MSDRTNQGLLSFESGKGNTLKIAFPEIEPLIPKYVIHFGLNTGSFKGEFGFDWMRESWLKAGGDCVEGLEDLKKIYSPFKMEVSDFNGKEYGDYYAPWLIMFPNHKEKVGADVQLVVQMPIDYLADDVPDTEVMTFTPTDGNIRIEPNSFTVSEMYNAKLVTIYCDDVIGSDAAIEVKSSTGELVGKLNIAKNSHHKDLTINIPVVKAYLTDVPIAGEGVIDAEIAKLPDLQAIEDYLNKNSLNQALVQVKFQYKDGKPYDWAFRKSSLVAASDGKNPRNGEEDYDYAAFKKMILDESTMKVDSGKILNFFHHQFKLRGEKVINEKNIILYITSLSTDSAGGVSFAVPLHNKHCIIFKSNLDHVASYAHEISHTLGLLHTFPENKYADKEAFIKEFKDEKKKLEANKVANAQVAKDHPYWPYINKRIKAEEDKIEGYKALFEVDKFKFNKKSTSNVMDYDLNDQKFFCKYQIDIMQNEAKKYYH